jgi:hypothetical protein
MNPLYHRAVDKLEITLDFLGRLTLPRLFICFLLIPVLVFWRPYFFFRVDDWTALSQMVDNPFWQYLNNHDAEQWFPFFHLVYYGLIKLAATVTVYWFWLIACLPGSIPPRFQFSGPSEPQSLFDPGLHLCRGRIAARCGSHNLCYILFRLFLGSLLSRSASATDFLANVRESACAVCSPPFS